MSENLSSFCHALFCDIIFFVFRRNSVEYFQGDPGQRGVIGETGPKGLQVKPLRVQITTGKFRSKCDYILHHISNGNMSRSEYKVWMHLPTHDLDAFDCFKILVENTSPFIVTNSLTSETFVLN